MTTSQGGQGAPARREIILVTGSSGLIGSAVIRRLADRYHVIGLDRAGPPEPPPVAECLTVDLTGGTAVRRSLETVRQRHGSRIASVIHLAAYYDFSGEPSPKYDTITVGGTRKLLHGLQGFQVEQFIFSSTMLVYAPGKPGQRIDEDWPVKPTWPYPRSKVETEQAIREGRGNMPAVLLRIAGVYDDRCHSIPLAHQIQRIYERRLTGHLFPGDLQSGQSFLHLDDLVDAIERLVMRRAQLPAELPLLVGEPETMSYAEIQKTLGRLIHGEEWETIAIPPVVAKVGAWAQDAAPLVEEPFIKPWMIDRADDHYALDLGRARTLLDWTPRRSLRARLPTMVAALKADPRGWYRDNELEPPAWLGAPPESAAAEQHRAE